MDEKEKSNLQREESRAIVTKSHNMQNTSEYFKSDGKRNKQAKIQGPGTKGELQPVQHKLNEK